MTNHDAQPGAEAAGGSVQHDVGGWISGPALDAPEADLLAAHGERWTIEATAGPVWTASQISAGGHRRRFVMAHSAAELAAKLNVIESQAP